MTCEAHLEECVLHQDVVTREDVPGAALATRGPAAVTQTCRRRNVSAEQRERQLLVRDGWLLGVEFVSSVDEF